jgi:protein-glucosylgalactosylhydroxylysine glucosidase
MKLSRRSLARHSVTMLATSAIPRGILHALGATTGFASSQQQSFSGPPKFAVEDFSKVFDPAYLSNGLIGIRPGPDPLAKAQTYVSGFVFAHPAHWVESLSPAPYPLGTDIRVREISLLKRPDLLKIRRQTLDMSCGELSSELVFDPGSGTRLNVEVLQFASRSVPSLVCQEIRLTSSVDAEIEVVASIDSDGVPGRTYLTQPPERTQIDLVSGFESEENLSKLGVALWVLSPDTPAQRQEPVSTESSSTRTYVLKLQAGRPVRFQTIAAMVSKLYHPEPPLEAIRLASWGSLLGFATLRSDNRAAWVDLWKSRVKVTGDADAQRVLDAAFFYIHSSVHASTRTGMPPFGLSQFSHYYGHSFWDTETWSLLPVILTAPEAARSLLEYRVRGLGYAKRQAALYGYRGAQFPWEAAPIGGFETTPTFAGTGWGEQHVTPDVALGFWEYQVATNDQNFLQESTWPVLKAVAEWIESRGVYSERGFEIQHIMGPDEDVPNISNVSYMNLICKMVLTASIRCAQMVGAHAPASWSKIRDALVLPIDNSKKIVQPYDNPPSPTSNSYSTGQMDFLTVHDIPIDIELLRRTHAFEETISRGREASSPGAGIPIGFAEAAISATAAFLGEKRRALELFHQSWRNAWLEPFGMIREASSQDYGCFLTNHGSLLQTVMLGFTGIRISEGDWAKYPVSLPAGWSRIEIDRIFVRGEAKRLIATDGAPAKLLSI